MYRSSYDELARRFTNGRNTKPSGYSQYYNWDEIAHHDLVSIPDLQRLHHKRSGQNGLLTHIGASDISIRANDGQTYRDAFKAFFFLGSQDKPIWQDPVLDRFGVEIISGQSVVAFVPYPRGDLDIGLVERFTPIGSVMLKNTRGSFKATGGPNCIVLPDHQQEVMDLRARIQ